MRFRKLIIESCFLQSVKEFYSSILQLPVKTVNESCIIVEIGGSDLVFLESNDSEPFYHFAINIPSNKIEEARDWLSKKVQVLWMEDYDNDIAEFVNWSARSVYFFDPGGNIVELIARFYLNNETEDPFSPTQLLSINEVGLVFNADKFDREVAALLTDYHLSYFNRQPPLPQFRAIGDDEGLFVVVPEHRNWFPTSKPSGVFPLTIDFMDGARHHVLNVTA